MTSIVAEQSSQLSSEGNGLLRFFTCGSVDDGKSTLIGRLLLESNSLFEDQFSEVEEASRRYGTTGGDADLALLLDGLEAEREQGITIDVAYRYFSTPRRKFIVADAPGHEQYTRNMVTAASNSDLALILVDIGKGMTEQTKRHLYLSSLLRVRHAVVVANKIDLSGYFEAEYLKITAELQAFCGELEFYSMMCIPVSARFGDNVTARSVRTPWYRGPSLLQYLERIEIGSDGAASPFRFPVQLVIKTEAYREYAGTLIGGSVSVGQEVRAYPSGRNARLRRIVAPSGDVFKAVAGEAVSLVLDSEIDISRGDVLAEPARPPSVASQFAAHIVWMADEPMLPHREYVLKLNTQTVLCRIGALKHRIDVGSLQSAAAKTLHLNDIGFCNLSTTISVIFDPYQDIRDGGGFILIDRDTNATVGAGMIDFALRRATTVQWQQLDVDVRARASRNGQEPCVLWFTGLSGAGKSTIANLVEKRLFAEGRHTYLLDGDNIRHGLNQDLGFTDEDRVENIRRVAEVAKLFVDAGIITLVSFISPFRAERRMARELFPSGRFVEIFVDTPIAICRERDPKGLYRRAAEGELKNFTGIDSPYEPPEKPEIVLQTENSSAEELSDQIIDFLRSHGRIP